MGCLRCPRSASSRIVFVAVVLTTSQQSVKQTKHLPASQLHQSPPMARARTPCFLPTESISVSGGHKTPLAILAMHAPISMAAASAVSLTMVLKVASCMPDPRCVVTPLDPGRVEELLCRYGIISAWKHVIHTFQWNFPVPYGPPKLTKTLSTRATQTRPRYYCTRVERTGRTGYCTCTTQVGQDCPVGRWT